MTKPLTWDALVRRKSRPKSLTRACHDGRLEGGLSISLRATPDEVVGPLTYALGPAARALKVTDVRSGPPMVLVIEWRELNEKWEVEDVAGLVHNLNDLLRDTGDEVWVVLGEWEDMLQLWHVPRHALAPLLDARLLDEARNLSTLHALREGSTATRDDG